jgi:hypothetical protein
MRLRLRIDRAIEGGHTHVTVFEGKEHGPNLGKLVFDSAKFAGLVPGVLRFENDAVIHDANDKSVIGVGDTFEVEVRATRVVRRHGLSTARSG